MTSSPRLAAAGLSLAALFGSVYARGQAASTSSVPGDLSLVGLLETEVVSASRSQESLARAPAVIDVITRQEIIGRGYHTVGEALQNLAGIDVTSDQYQDSVGVRGISGGVRGWSRGIKVMIDGQPVSFRPSGENFLGVSLLPVGVIDRIEVIRGPGSALYGANAFVGVIDIITRSGYDLGDNSVTLGYEVGPKVASPWGEAVVAQQWNDVSILLGAVEDTRTLDGYRIVPLPGSAYPAYLTDRSSSTRALPSGSVYGRVAYDSEKFGTLSIDGNLQRLHRSAEFSDWGVLTHDNRSDLLNGYVRLGYHVELGQALELSASGALSRGGVGPDDHLDIAPRRPSDVERRVGYTGRDLTASATYHLGTSSWVSAGCDGTWDDQELLSHFLVTSTGGLIRNPPVATLTGTKLFQNLGVFANTTLYAFGASAPPALQNLGVTAGARFDAHNVYGSVWNARGGLVYAIEERHFVKLLYGTSFRAPSSTQLYANLIVPQGTIGNPDLRPERARTLELALGASLLRDLTVRLDGFYTVISDRLEIRRAPTVVGGRNPIPTNSTPITSRGFEAQVDYKGSRWDAFANYSFQYSTYETPDIPASSTATVRTDGYPTHLLKGGIIVTHRPWYLRAHLEGRYVGARLGDLQNNSLIHPIDFLTNRYRLPGYGLVDVGVSSVGLEPWKGHETILQFRVQNLFDARYAFPGYSGFDIPGFERSYMLSMQQEL